MDKNRNGLICAVSSWAFGILSAFVGFIVLTTVGTWTITQAVFASTVILLIVAPIASWIACRPLPGPNEARAAPPRDDHPVKSSAESAAAAVAAAKSGATAPEPAQAAPASSPAAAVAAAKAGMKPSAALAGEADLAERKAQWRYEGGDAAPASAAAAEPAEAASGAAEPAAPEDVGTRPEALDAPRGGEADNLKEIKGIGPKLEILCNTLGFYHFDQIAQWSEAEVAWVDANLEGFKGRVTRDDWVAQAKVLAAGGETEFSKRVDDGDVY